MYTSNSKYVSEENKNKIMDMALEMRPYVSQIIDSAEDSGFSGGKQINGSYYLKDNRYYDSEQVFQSFCQKFVQSEEDAKNLDKVLADIDVFQGMMIQALLNAASCDHWYRYEKEY